MSKPMHVEIVPRKNEQPERMIRRFIKKVKKEGILEEIRQRKYFVKPSEVRRKQRKERKAVMRKAQAQRDSKN